MNTLLPKNTIEFRLWGRYALFTDPLTKIGGEKCSYHLPTYEALKGVCKSIYWKPTIIWVVDAVRVMKRIRTQTKGTKPLEFSGGNTLAIYTFLSDVEYQVRAHFIWNDRHEALENDRIEGKHFAIAKRMLDRGGRQDIFLGTRDCQGYVAPCVFGEGQGSYDEDDEIGYSLMFHGFDYPDEKKGSDELCARFWYPTLKKGVLTFDRPEDCKYVKFVRKMDAKTFGTGNVKSVCLETEELEVMI
ncbi:MAG: type I-C CRISPR-associated protein Cas5c [Candidatus Vecturithrix sp.]|jgi:CRISPR-associated protein Cas5d|nr:type I-C CRISPR-associated protein Cas5c [Candidatus Vecturithrix sp.]